jgi:hypothetical protein
MHFLCDNDPAAQVRPPLCFRPRVCPSGIGQSQFALCRYATGTCVSDTAAAGAAEQVRCTAASGCSSAAERHAGAGCSFAFTCLVLSGAWLLWNTSAAQRIYIIVVAAVASSCVCLRCECCWCHCCAQRSVPSSIRDRVHSYKGLSMHESALVRWCVRLFGEIVCAVA